MRKYNYDLLLMLLDSGWEVKQFNAREITLVPCPRPESNRGRRA